MRDAAKGECCLVTDNRKPAAMIGPPSDPVEEEHASRPPANETKPVSGAVEFRKALFGIPFPIEANF